MNSNIKVKEYKIERHVKRVFCECGGELIFNTQQRFLKYFTEGLNKEYEAEHICLKCGKKIILKDMYPKNEDVYIEI